MEIMNSGSPAADVERTVLVDRAPQGTCIGPGESRIEVDVCHVFICPIGVLRSAGGGEWIDIPASGPSSVSKHLFPSRRFRHLQMESVEKAVKDRCKEDAGDNEEDDA
jgi:hypothetical protein